MTAVMLCSDGDFLSYICHRVDMNETAFPGGTAPLVMGSEGSTASYTGYIRLHSIVVRVILMRLMVLEMGEIHALGKATLEKQTLFTG